MMAITPPSSKVTVNPSAPSISVLGAGSYGTALAILLARNGQNVFLWGHCPDELVIYARERKNQHFLPNINFPTNLHIEANLETAVTVSDILLIVVPSYAFRDVLTKIRPYLHKGSKIVWATKGLDPDSGSLLQDVAFDVIGNKIPLAVISGPSFAKEVAAAVPTAVTVASTEPAFLNQLQSLFHCSKSFRVYGSQDLIGVQLGGAVKNVIAIGAGLSDGMGFGANARTALITRGLTELMRLGKAMGADPATFMGMAGLGDLVLTCTDNQSRNRRFGMLLGQNKSIEEAQSIIEQVVEGYPNAREVRQLAKRYQVDMPIVEEVYQILYCHKAPQQAAMDLLGRSRKNEIDAQQS